MNAHDMYQDGYCFPKKIMSVKKMIDCYNYYNQLTAKIIEEASRYGYSSLQVVLLCRGEETIYLDVVTYGAVANARKYLQSGNSVEAEQGMDYILCVPKKITFRNAADKTAEYLNVNKEFLDFRGGKAAATRAKNTIAEEEYVAESYAAFLANISDNSETMLRQLNQEYQRVLDTIGDWRQELYKLQFELLINAYLELYALDQYAQKEEDIRSMSCQKDETINQLVKKIAHLKRNLEKAMNQLGLTVFIPKRGETFDENKYSLENEEMGYEKLWKIIKKCTVPGVYKVQNGKQHILKTAEVILE